MWSVVRDVGSESGGGSFLLGSESEGEGANFVICKCFCKVGGKLQEWMEIGGEGKHME